MKAAILISMPFQYAPEFDPPTQTSGGFLLQFKTFVIYLMDVGHAKRRAIMKTRFMWLLLSILVCTGLAATGAEKRQFQAALVPFHVAAEYTKTWLDAINGYNEDSNTKKEV